MNDGFEAWLEHAIVASSSARSPAGARVAAERLIKMRDATDRGSRGPDLHDEQDRNEQH